jgi:hypothetical protein
MLGKWLQDAGGILARRTEFVGYWQVRRRNPVGGERDSGVKPNTIPL